jgi:hypothetical protein
MQIDSKADKRGNMLDVPTLTSQAQEIAKAHSFWNSWSVIFVAVTALAAVLYFIGQWMTNERGKELNIVQSDLIRTKDEELARNLKDKDLAVKRVETEGRENIAKVKAESDEKIAGLTAEAERAKTERAEADRQIAIAKADAARAKEGIANAEARSIEAAAEVSRLRVTVANAEQKRAEAESALLKLQEEVRPRHVSEEQRKYLLRLLTEGPKGQFKLVSLLSAPDADTFSEELGEVLLTAGWTATVKTVSILPFKGVRVYAGTDKVKQKLAEFLKGILTQVGIKTDLVFDAELKDDDLMLVIGEKP